MVPVAAPPHATAFVSGGVVRYLYMGNKELQALRVAWGLGPEPGDTEQQEEAKDIAFALRFTVATKWQERRDIMHAFLGPWADEAGVAVTADQALRIFEAAELPDDAGRRFPPVKRFNRLWNRFLDDNNCKVPGDGDLEPADPKAPALEASAPSGS